MFIRFSTSVLVAHKKQVSSVVACGSTECIWLFFPAHAGYLREHFSGSIYTGVGLTVSPCLYWLLAGGKLSDGGQFLVFLILYIVEKVPAAMVAAKLRGSFILYKKFYFC